VDLVDLAVAVVVLAVGQLGRAGVDVGVLGVAIAELLRVALGVVAGEHGVLVAHGVAVAVVVGVVEARLEALVELAVAIVVARVAQLRGAGVDGGFIVVAVAPLLDQPLDRLARELGGLLVAIPVTVDVGVVGHAVAAVRDAHGEGGEVVVGRVAVAVAGDRPRREIS